MYRALRNETLNLTPEDARGRIENDCRGIWEKRTILEFLPDEAKDPEKQESGRLGKKKHNSAAAAAAPLIQKKREIIIDMEGKAIDNGTALTSMPDYPSPPKSNDNEDHLQLQFSVPLKDILGPLLELKAWNEETIWFDVVFEKSTSHVISANIGKKSREIMAQKSQEYIEYQ